MDKIPRYLLNLTGEYRVCSELNKRRVFATITYGNCKGADIYVIGKGKFLKIEVKTSQRSKFPTNLKNFKETTGTAFLDGQEQDSTPPDFWVLVQVRPSIKSGFLKERFFILSHDELCVVQKSHDDTYALNYLKRTGIGWDNSKGVAKVSVTELAEYRDKWQKIVDAVRQTNPH